MQMYKIPAVFMRGGTSKALIFHDRDLPRDPARRDAVFLAAMGVPDPNGRQLDGMGGGVSSLNKVCIVGPPSHPGADVDYTFAQLSVYRTAVDYGGNCGNMSSAIGPFAVEEGLVECSADGEASVRIHNTNTGKIIVARFPVRGGGLAPDGNFELAGVAGTAAPIRLEFLEPGGSRTGRLLPTGSPRDIFKVEGIGEIEASCIDAANPAVFVRAKDIGKNGVETPQELEADEAYLAVMESIRRQASVAMGLSSDLNEAGELAAIPKVAMISEPQDANVLDGALQKAADKDIDIRMISVGQQHLAVPITGAVCLGVAARIEGSLPHEACRSQSGPIRIAHPSGITVVDARLRLDDAGPHATLGAVYRTARRLFEGNVAFRLPDLTL